MSEMIIKNLIILSLLLVTGCLSNVNKNPSTMPSPNNVDARLSKYQAIDFRRCLEAEIARSIGRYCKRFKNPNFNGIQGIEEARDKYLLAVYKDNPNEQLAAAVLAKDIEAVIDAINRGADVNHQFQMGDRYTTPVYSASRGFSDVNIIKLLVTNGADLNIVPEGSSFTLLYQLKGRDIYHGTKLKRSWQEQGLFLIENGYNITLDDFLPLNSDFKYLDENNDYLGLMRVKALETGERPHIFEPRIWEGIHEYFIFIRENASKDVYQQFVVFMEQQENRQREERQKIALDAAAERKGRAVKADALLAEIKTIGVRVCRKQESRTYGRVTYSGYVERVSENNIQIRVVSAYVGSSRTLSPGGFKPNIIWDSASSLNWLPC